MATQAEIVDAIEGLAVHARPPIMDEDTRTRWLLDWCQDLGGFPADAIHRAVGEWRRSGSVKFPTPGQLIPLVAKYAPSERRYEPKPVEPWRHPTEEEYATMSLRDKIASHVVMAHELRGKAGPMFRQDGGGRGTHLTREQMPPKWHTLQREADFHSNKAAELRKKLQQVSA